MTDIASATAPEFYARLREQLIKTVTKRGYMLALPHPTSSATAGSAAPKSSAANSRGMPSSRQPSGGPCSRMPG